MRNADVCESTVKKLHTVSEDKKHLTNKSDHMLKIRN